jgi:SAM-dependent methyltransferase
MFKPEDRKKCEALYAKYYNGRRFFDTLYRDLIREHLRPDQRLLDAGCGRYLRYCREFSSLAQVVGIDLDSVLETDNRSAPFAVRGDLGKLPFPPGYFDVVISRSVVEHLEYPEAVFREFCRVLRPGGKVIIVTPNKYDYVSLIAAMTPYKLHRALVSRIFRVPEDDVFPTLYRANTISKMRKTLERAGFRQIELETVNHYPAYLMFSPLLFRLGVLYERLTSLRPLAWLRGSILCVFEKTDPGQEHPTSAGVPPVSVEVS